MVFKEYKVGAVHSWPPLSCHGINSHNISHTLSGAWAPTPKQPVRALSLRRLETS